MKKLILALSAGAILLSSCTDTLDKKISTETFAKDLKEIQAEHSSDYDSLDFATLALGVGFGKMMGAEKEITNKTYREVLEEFKTERVKEEKAQAEKKALYERKVAEWKDSQAKLNKVVAFKVTGKDFYTDSYGIREQQMFKYLIQNNSGKDIKALKGGFYVYDTFGEVVGRYGIEVENPMSAGKSINDEIYYDYNSYDSDNVKVKGVSLKDLKYEWQTAMVIFADGSVMEAQEEPSELEFL
jgi:hypothetical protein